MQPSQSPGEEEDDDEDEEEEDDEDAKSGRSGRSARERPAATPNRRISPFDIHFSQVRCRTTFRDGRELQEAVAQIQAVRSELKEPADGAEGAGDGTCEQSTGEDGASSAVGAGAEDAEVWLLEAPFPPIEVLKWRCKLRDEQTGRPRIDPKTGGELVDRERHFSLDNRRLYCLQKAAASIWPKRAVVDVVELPPGSLMRQRQLKKFRTLDSGRSIMIGCRADAENQLRWSWRRAVGAVDKEPEPSTDACEVQMRRRPRAEHRAAWVTAGASSGSPPPQRSRRPPRSASNGDAGERSGDAADGAEDAGSGINPLSGGGILMILLIYLALRLSVNVVTEAYTQFR